MMTRTEALKIFMRDMVGHDHAFHDLVDDLVREAMQDNIRYILGPEADKFETPDNVAKDLNAFYTVLKYYSNRQQYEKFLEEVKS